MKKVVLVGHCGPDAGYLRVAVQSALKDVTVQLADDVSTLNRMIGDGVDLILVNRVLDYGFNSESGPELIAELRRTNPNLRFVLVSNYPEAQAEAIAAGAFPGFGKREIGTPRVKQIIREALGITDDKRVAQQ